MSETLNHLIDAKDEEMISAAELEQFRQKVNEVERILNGYIHFLELKSGEK